MFLKKIEIEKYKVLENISINFEEKQNHNFFPVISVNGGGKSTLLQFIFTFLHCSFVEKRQKYLKTLLEYYQEFTSKDKINKIAKFEIEHEKQIINLEFHYCKSVSKNFNSIITLKELLERKKNIEKAVLDIELLNRIENDLKNSNISPLLAWQELYKFREIISVPHENSSANISEMVYYINKIRKNFENSLISDFDLNTLIIKEEAEKNKLVAELEKENLGYVFHFNKNNDVLLFKSNVNQDVLVDISEKIYLATPNTQVLHFFESEQLSSLFKKDLSIYSTYEYYLRKCQEEVKGLFTYEFSAINLILEALQKARDEDFKKALETGSYGTQINTTLKELNNLLSGKSITIDNNFEGVTFMTTNTKITLTPKDLSNGELKKLSIYIWLKAKTNKNSVILMDEVDMGLHPTWQHELYNDLQKWSVGNQFIIATHSPQIISKAHYKNLVVIKHTETGATSEQYHQPPLESDLNTIVKTIMGSDYIPKELLELRKEYRKLFENDKLETDEAKEIKKQILVYESENSSFFQDIKFQMELRR